MLYFQKGCAFFFNQNEKFLSARISRPLRLRTDPLVTVSALISMAGERWLFTRSQLANTPSRKCGQSSDKELTWRQQAANLIQDMGQKLQVYPKHTK